MDCQCQATCWVQALPGKGQSSTMCPCKLKDTIVVVVVGGSSHSQVMIKFLLSCWEEGKKNKSINCEGSKG